MAEFLPATAEDYVEALKFFKMVGQLANNQREAKMDGLAVDALRFAVLRKENRFLRREHLKDMHLCPVFFTGNGMTNGLPGGGFVDANRGAVIILDEVSGGLKYHSINWEFCGSSLRFPPDGADLKDIYQ